MENSPENLSLHRWVKVIENRIQRVGERHFIISNGQSGLRNQYHRDFDRLIFSSAFKRLQNKTQVFPLPGTAQVHNRLTHSLEVSSVGRSLGNLVGNKISFLLEKGNEKNKFTQDVIDFYRYELKDVILAACLAHDIGNPCFGHSGEKIISDYFKELRQNLSKFKGREKELKKIRDEEWEDLSHFEGNANTLRVLTTEYFGKLPGGLRLTYLTLASIMKYPWDAVAMANFKKLPSELKVKKNKYGFFQEQMDIVANIASSFNLLWDKERIGIKCFIFRRHPFVYLVEAADDICYTIMDLEDAQKIGILSTEEVKSYFWELFNEVCDIFFPDKEELDVVKEKEMSIEDEREKVVYLRSKCINILTEAAGQVFMDNDDKILNGTSEDLIHLMVEKYGVKSLKQIQEISFEKIYNYHTVSETMVGASHILPELLDWFLPSILAPNTGIHNYREKKIFSLINPQYRGKDFDTFKKISPYKRILSLLDFLTGMTDEYITEYYRKLKGIDSAKLSS